jgi:putative transposase
VSPAERHDGGDHNILARRHTLYREARAANPRRWTRHTRNWQPIGVVTLNPERESIVNAALELQRQSASAA